jgi:histidinol-phosphatase
MSQTASSYNDDLRLAHVLADSVDSQTMSRFKALDLRIETKPDLTPVTDADKSAEEAIRGQLSRSRPRDAVLGEEFGSSGHGSRRWIIDPIDGTKNFSRGLPVWATLIALERNGVVVCGVVSAPALGHRWWAARGEGAWRDGERIAVSGVGALADAAVSCAYGADLAAFEPRVWHARGLGDFWQHVLVAEGALDAAIDARLSIWDYAAVTVIVEEAGGRSGAPDGGAARPGEQLVSTNAVLHEAVLELLRR